MFGLDAAQYTILVNGKPTLEENHKSDNLLLYRLLGLNGPIGPFNPRPCGQLRALPNLHLEPANHPFILIFSTQGLPFGHQGSPLVTKILPSVTKVYGKHVSGEVVMAKF